MDAPNESSPQRIRQDAEKKASRLHVTSGVPDGAVVVDVPGDGSCMFHAVFLGFFYAMRSKAIDPKKDAEKLKKASYRLRAACVDYLLRHYRRPLGGVKGNLTSRELILLEYASDASAKQVVKGPKTYKEYMMRPTTYGGETELHGLSGLLKVGIVIHNTKENDMKGIYYNTLRGQEVSDTRANPWKDIVIHLAYDPDLEHYAAILPIAR